MTYTTAKWHRALIRLAYLLPFLCMIALTVYAAIPNMWFINEGVAQPNLSLFELLGKTAEVCNETLANAEATNQDLAFANTMNVACIAYWILYAVCWLFSIAVATCSLIAFSFPPTHLYCRRTKRILHLLCPNRVAYLIFCALPILPSLFPYILLYCYKTYTALEIGMGAEPFDAWVAALIAVLLSGALFVLTLPWQKGERLDMFRIHRAGNAVKRQGEESV